MTAIITALETRAITIPLDRPWGAQVTQLSVVEVAVRMSDGNTGWGFSWTPSIGASAVRALLDDDISRAVVGEPDSPELWQRLWQHLHEAGGGGITTIAMAGVDLALWDLRTKNAGTDLASFLGRHHETLPVYGSGVNLHYSVDELAAQAQRWVDAGMTGAKIKVGKADLAEDRYRVATVREILGPDRALFIDANQRWDLDTATRALEALSESGLDWIEEPLRADDLGGYIELRRRTAVPIAAGENFHNVHRFRDFLRAEAIDVMQPNIIRVGGITPAREIATLAQEFDTQIAFHLLPELSAQLAFTLPAPTWVEDVESAGFDELGALSATTGFTFAHGTISGGPDRGLGLRFR